MKIARRRLLLHLGAPVYTRGVLTGSSPGQLFDEKSLHLISFRQGEVIGLFQSRLHDAGNGCDSATFVASVRT